jgi:hypothetical protein
MFSFITMKLNLKKPKLFIFFNVGEENFDVGCQKILNTLN